MIRFFCDCTNQRFAAAFDDWTPPLHVLTQDTREPFSIYLVRATNNLRYPFSYDPLSGSAALESPVVTLCNPGSSPLTLSEPALVTPVRNGFTGILNLSTAEIAAFLGTNRAEREAVLSFDAIINDLPRTLFQGRLLIRPDAVAPGGVTAAHQLSGTSDDLALIAAGITDLAPDAQFVQWFVRVNVTPGGAPFTHQITLDSARALPGATFTVQVVIPASAFPPTIEIYDNGVSSALLDTIIGDTDNEVNYRFQAVLDETSWIKESGEYLV